MPKIAEMTLIRFEEKAYVSKLPILRLCYAVTTFYRLPVPTGLATGTNGRAEKENEARAKRQEMKNAPALGSLIEWRAGA